jgi:hypothetical protein
MKKMLLNFIIAFSLLFSTGNVLAVASAASPTDVAKANACQGINANLGTNCTSGGTDLKKVLAAVLRILSVAAGIASVIMIIISGMKYITSGGDSNSVASAKRTLIYALVGLIIVALSQSIVKFVLKKV